MKRVWHKQKRKTKHLHIVVCVALSFVLTLVMFLRCRPVLTAFAESQAVWIATKIINEEAELVLRREADLCRDAVSVSYNELQQPCSVSVDTAAVNTIKTNVAAAIIEELEKNPTMTVGIPLGTLLSLDWLSGWGPVIPFSMSMTATVLSAVSSSIEAVGMNQSNYRVSVDISVGLYVVTPGGRSSVSTDFSFPMAETVLLGEVPDNLTEVYGDDQTLLGKIFDYGTAE